MQKTAQRRGILNKLREKTNLGGIAAEKFFTPEFSELMNQLREGTDDPVRAILSGTQIGNASAPDDAISLKDLLKDTKSAINRREYMKAVANLGRFHKKLYDATKILSGFKANVDSIHEKFLFEGLDDDSKKHLTDLQGRINAKEASYNQKYFIKEANIMDFFANIGTERGRALAAWEKRYPKQVGKLKNDTTSMLRRSESLMTNVLSTLKDMATARATRNVDKYLLGADKIVKLYAGYDVAFKEYYNANVKGFLEKQNIIKKDEPASGFELDNSGIPIGREEDGPFELQRNNQQFPKDEIELDTSGPRMRQREPVEFDLGNQESLPEEGAVPAKAPSIAPAAPAVEAPATAPAVVNQQSEDKAPTDRVGKPDFDASHSNNIYHQISQIHGLRPLQQFQTTPKAVSAPAAIPAPVYKGVSSKTDRAPAQELPEGRTATFYGVAPESRATVRPSVAPATMRPSKVPSMPVGREPSIIPDDDFAVPQEAPRQDVRKSDDGMVAAAHQSFYKTLTVLGQTESPAVLSMYIRKYAATIQHKDLVTALKLFELAKSIKE